MIEPKIKTRIEYLIKDKINDFSPTISPAPKSAERNEIESISKALEYFKNNNIDEVVVQKKYMGSYCSIYLKRNILDTYLVSRNGYKINHIDTEKAIQTLVPLHEKLNTLYPDFDTIIIASEMLPWRALGRSLIDKEYEAYYAAKKVHYDYLNSSNLYEKLEKVKNSDTYKEFSNFTTLPTDYPQHIKRQYQAVKDMVIMDLNDYEKVLNVYRKQLDYFGIDEDVYFKPFNILKIIYDDKEIIPNSNKTFEQINDDHYLVCGVDEVDKVYTFYNDLVDNMAEGIVIKPVQSYVKGIVPAFKVRNDNYLSMIYGINFKQDFEYYFERRNIRLKMQQSINNWDVNNQILNNEYKSIDENNYLIRLQFLKRINDEEIEKTIDTRL